MMKMYLKNNLKDIKQNDQIICLQETISQTLLFETNQFNLKKLIGFLNLTKICTVQTFTKNSLKRIYSIEKKTKDFKEK